jgi:hypothetical protein
VAAITMTAANVRPINERYTEVMKVAGEALTGGQWVYVKTSDARVYKATAAAANNAANVLGQVAKTTAVGKPVTVFTGNSKMTGATGLSPGLPIFLSDTAGGSDTAAGTVNRIVGLALTATEYMITCPALK